MANHIKNYSNLICYPEGNALRVVDGLDGALKVYFSTPSPSDTEEFISTLSNFESELVTQDDVDNDPDNYQTDSIGLYKTIKEYPANAISGDPAILYTFYYTSLTAGWVATQKIATMTTV